MNELVPAWPRGERLEPGLGAQLEVAGGDQAGPVGEQHHRQPRRLAREARDQLAHRGVLVDVHPLVGDLVARQELARRVALGRPARSHHADPFERRARPVEPTREQVVEHRVEPLLGRVPGFHQIVVEARFVDGGDRRGGVGVGGEQHPHGVGVELARFAQEGDPGHPRHALVHQQQRHRPRTPLKLPQGLERLRARARGDDAVLLAIVPPEVALDRAQHVAIVVHRQQDRLSHHSVPGRSLRAPRGGAACARSAPR
jgi:hypothetical protein